MAHTDTSLTPRVAFLCVRAVTNAATAVSDWKNARATRHALGRLSLEELDDIGLQPGDIENIARRR